MIFLGKRKERKIIFPDDIGKIIFQHNFFGKIIFPEHFEKESMVFRAMSFRIPAGNGMHISKVTVRHFVGMVLKVFTLEELKLPIDLSTSTLSTPEK